MRPAEHGSRNLTRGGTARRVGMFERLRGAITGSRSAAAPPAGGANDDADADADADDGDGDDDDEGFTPEAKPPGAVVLRLVVTVLVAELASTVSLEQEGARDQAIAARRGVFDALVRLGLSPDDLETAERDLAFGLRSGHVVPRAVTAAQWRLETAPVLVWALGLRESFPSAEEPADLGMLRGALPADAAGLEQLTAAAAATMRPLGAWMEQRALWMERMLPLLEQPASAPRSRAIERLRALLWLTDPGEEELSAVAVV